MCDIVEKLSHCLDASLTEVMCIFGSSLRLFAPLLLAHVAADDTRNIEFLPFSCAVTCSTNDIQKKPERKRNEAIILVSFPVLNWRFVVHYVTERLTLRYSDAWYTPRQLLEHELYFLLSHTQENN